MGCCFLSETGLFSERFGIPIPLYRYLGNGVLDLLQIVGRKRDSKCADVLIQTFELPAARNWNDPRLLSEQPGECDLGWCRSLLFSDPDKQIDDHLVCFPRLRRKTRQAAADINAGEGRVFVD